MRGVVMPAVISALINCLGACSSAQPNFDAQRHFDGLLPKTPTPATISDGRFGTSIDKISRSNFGTPIRDASADDLAASSAAYGNEIDPVAKGISAGDARSNPTAYGKAMKTPAVPNLASRRAPLDHTSSPAVPSSLSPVIAIVTYPFQQGEASANPER